MFDLRKYPFDVQYCELVLTLVKYSTKQVNFSNVEISFVEYNKGPSGQFNLTLDGVNMVKIPFLITGLHQTIVKFKVIIIHLNLKRSDQLICCPVILIESERPVLVR